MDAETRTTDSKGRVILPKAFANSTASIEQVSDEELRVRKPRVAPEDEASFREESPLVLSARDLFLEALERPPEPKAVSLRAAARHLHGGE